MTGREWFVKSTVFLRLSILIVVVPVVHWLLEDKNAAVLWYAVPWILGGLAAFKVSAAALLATRLYRGRVVGDASVVSVHVEVSSDHSAAVTSTPVRRCGPSPKRSTRDSKNAVRAAPPA